MRLFSIFFLLGTLSIQLFSILPSIIMVGVVTALAVLSMVFISRKSSQNKKYRGVAFLGLTAFFIGLLIAVYSAQQQTDARLPKAHEGKDISVHGTVIDIPESREDGVRFRFKVTSAFDKDDGTSIPVSGIVRLVWYKSRVEVSAGEQWQLLVRLKQPAGFMNPGGFDYEKWLFTERIIATGYVRQATVSDNNSSKESSYREHRKLFPSQWWSINHIRQQIHETIQQRVPDKTSAAILSALSVADRSKLGGQQWESLQKTGTSHLIAISGLHIAIVAGFAFLPVLLVWRIFPSLNERIPVRVAGGIVGILFATVYAMLAGFTLPTQRALLMVIIALLGLISRRNYPTSSILAAALIVVLLFDPLAAMTISFWLSFLAVGIILLISKRRIGKLSSQESTRTQKFFQLTHLQIMLSLGMFPLGLIFFGTASVSSPIANLFAIPWVSLIVVPLTLLGVLFIPLSSVISDSLFVIAALAIDLLFKGLDYLATRPYFDLSLPEIPFGYLLIAFGGFLFILLPKGFPARWLGLVALLPSLFFIPEEPRENSFTFTLLDAGQGMASVLQTKNHTLIYDVGKRVNDNFDIGKLVVVPYLNSKGLNDVDLMMISHEDLDHRGGAEAVLEVVQVDGVMSSDLNILSKYSHLLKACKAGDRWNWDGVDFEVLSPPVSWLKKSQLSNEAKHEIKDNNLSCVLKVSTKSHSLLLTGDIEKQMEGVLLEKYGDKLRSNVMIVPHHGSRTSSTNEFISVVNPALALVPVGYRNRFGHPKDDVISRYKTKGISVMDTVKYGALKVDFVEGEKEVKVRSYRQEKQKFWNR